MLCCRSGLRGCHAVWGSGACLAGARVGMVMRPTPALIPARTQMRTPPHGSRAGSRCWLAPGTVCRWIPPPGATARRTSSPLL